MTKKKLKAIERKINKLRGGNTCKPRELEALARSLGRSRAKRGSEPTWVSVFNDQRPLSIPHHSREVGPYTAGNILDELERDVWAWRDALERKERIDALKGEGADAKED